MMMDEGQDRVRATYGDNYERLARSRRTTTRPTCSASTRTSSRRFERRPAGRACARRAAAASRPAPCSRHCRASSRTASTRAQGLSPVQPLRTAARVVFKHDAPGVPSGALQHPRSTAASGRRGSPSRARAVELRRHQRRQRARPLHAQRRCGTQPAVQRADRRAGERARAARRRRRRPARDPAQPGRPQGRLPAARPRRHPKVVPTEGPAAAGRRLTAPFAAGATAVSVRISDDSRSVAARSSAPRSSPGLQVTGPVEGDGPAKDILPDGSRVI